MDEIIAKLIELINNNKKIDNHIINRVIFECVGNDDSNRKKYSKKRLVPYFLKCGKERWNIDQNTANKLLKALQIKPRRTASGVATITIMTKPWPCASACIYCPNDIRMPKSYLSDEPVCQRAEYAFFDPYLQVISRLRALKQMGHPTDKIEIIILGGTWSDYTQEYQIWFVKQVFLALNDSQFLKDDDNFENVSDPNNPFAVINNSPKVQSEAMDIETNYIKLGVERERNILKAKFAQTQKAIDENNLSYNDAFQKMYTKSEIWQNISQFQTASLDELYQQQCRNETSKHRVVGLVIETRPDSITSENLKLIRELGCTKIQMGIQSLAQNVLDLNERKISISKIAESFALLRLYGFKIHIHFMVNLYGSNCQNDKDDYKMLVTDERFKPDEIKLYPCVLVKGTILEKLHADGKWKPYTEEELVDVLVYDTLITPNYARISRMIRDISAHDIVAGNKKSNLRQVVENKITQNNELVSEIRYREVSVNNLKNSILKLDITHYDTQAADEYFLQWVDQNMTIAGFLRLSLPKTDDKIFIGLPDAINADNAMIREVHVYGKVANLNSTSEGAQHQGLGRKLIEKACIIAKENGYQKINVISAIGTKEYYRKLGFKDVHLYQQKDLV